MRRKLERMSDEELKAFYEYVKRYFYLRTTKGKSARIRKDLEAKSKQASKINRKMKAVRRTNTANNRKNLKTAPPTERTSKIDRTKRISNSNRHSGVLGEGG